MEIGRGRPKPPNTWKEVGNFFHFLSYFLLLTECLTCLLISKCGYMCDTPWKPYTCMCLGEMRPVNQVALNRGRALAVLRSPAQSAYSFTERQHWVSRSNLSQKLFFPHFAAAGRLEKGF